MPIPVSVMVKLKNAQEQMHDGRLQEAQTAIIQAELMLETFRPALLPFEALATSAAIATLLKRCGNINGALVRLEKVCHLALELEPDSSQTLGDLCDLAECYETVGRLPEALATYQRASGLCLRLAPHYLSQLDAKICALKEKTAASLFPPLGSVQTLRVRLQCFSVNYSLVHSSISPLTALQLQNDAAIPVQDAAIEVAVRGYTIPGPPLRVRLETGETKEVGGHIRFDFVLDRLAAQTERARVPISVHVDGWEVARQETWVLAYNECSWQPGHEKALAAFVHPNNCAVEAIARQARGALQKLGSHHSFLSLRASEDPNSIEIIARAVYDCLKDQYDLVYDYEAPCWESLSQRVRFPDEIIVNGIGTCNDFMLLVASVLENVLYGSPRQPVLLITVGSIQHALIGCWRERSLSSDAVISDRQSVLDWVSSGSLFLMDSTGFARDNPFWGKPAEFDECVETGQNLARSASRLFAVDLVRARPDYKTGRPGITPLPFRREPPYDERALHALRLARNAWQEAPTEQLQTAHLLIGLLKVEGSEAARFFDQLARETGNPLVCANRLATHLIAGLRQLARHAEAPPTESESCTAAKAAAKLEAIRLHALTVNDLHLLFALLRRPGASVTKALQQRNTSPQECLAYLENLHPCAEPPVGSAFPSQVYESVRFDQT